MKRCLFGLHIFIFTLVFSQNKSEKVKYERLTKYPLFSSSYSHYPESNLANGQINVDVLENVVNMAFPIKPKKTYVSVRFVHSFFRLKTKFDNESYRINETYQSFEFGGGLIKILPKHWRLVATFNPSIASDFKSEIHKDDWIFRSNLLATKRINHHSSFTIGMLFTSRFGNPLILPMLGYTHKKKDWTTRILLPAFAYVRKQIWKNVQFGVKMTIESNVYNADFRNHSFNNELINRLAYTRILIGPELLIPVYKSVYINFTGGIALRNIFETQDYNLNNGLSFDARSRAFFNFGIKILK